MTQSTAQVGHTLAYRPDIDGLRAVAVLAVIANHASRSLLPGGFCGVDVFFVISGFLITGIILGEVSTGRFSLGRFYSRRIRRIFPALGIMLLLCMAAGHRVLLPDEFRVLGKHVVASVGFLENVLLYRSLGYFAPAAEQTPLLHLWSLAVEEHFYVVFPLLVAALGRLRWRPAPVFVVLLVASFAACCSIAGRDADAGFYLAWYRGWELLAGSLLAVWQRHGGRPPDGRAADVLAACGVGGLAFSMWWLDSRLPYPGWRAAIPVASAALLIGAGNAAWINRGLLSNRFAVAVGLVSYPLYLFHWPLLSFLHIRHGGSASVPVVEIVAALVVIRRAKTSHSSAPKTGHHVGGIGRKNPVLRTLWQGVVISL